MTPPLPPPNTDPDGAAGGSSTDHPLVSVVIPCYNQGHYLADAMRSVRGQSYHPIETVVVDDGSTDRSAALAQREGVVPIRQPNRGISAARNAGLGAARGKYVVFLDADDELLPDAVRWGVEMLEARPELSGIVRRCRVMDAERRNVPTYYPPVQTGDLYRQWLGHNFVWTPGAAIFRRDRIAAAGGFPDDVGPAADYAVYLTFARSGEVAYDPRDAVRYRQHDSNMSRDPVVMLRATLEVLRRERRHLPIERRSAVRAGLRRWREHYGEQIIERLRREWRSGRRGTWWLSAVWTLVRYCPGVLARHVTRKLGRLVRGLSPEPIEPGRFDPDPSAFDSRQPPIG